MNSAFGRRCVVSSQFVLGYPKARTWKYLSSKSCLRSQWVTDIQAFIVPLTWGYTSPFYPHLSYLSTGRDEQVPAILFPGGVLPWPSCSSVYSSDATVSDKMLYWTFKNWCYLLTESSSYRDYKTGGFLLFGNEWLIPFAILLCFLRVKHFTKKKKKRKQIQS